MNIGSLIEEYLNFLNQQNKKQIVTKEIENSVIKLLGQDEYWKQGGYRVFATCIESLVEQEKITPVKASKSNELAPALYNKYRIMIEKDEPDQATRNRMLTWYHPRISTGYYLKHFKHFKEDEPYLSRLDNFLKQHDGFAFWPFVAANERSFQIFNDEKWLLSGHGHAFCQRAGLTLKDLRCYQTTEPFFYYSAGIPSDINEINVLIIENKDTFFSLKSLFKRGVSNWDGISFSLLIYGEGRKIQKSICFFQELEEYRKHQAHFYYFGDIDPEGILIWYDLKISSGIEIKPFTLFYNALYENHHEHAPLLRKTKQKLFSQEAIAAFLSNFDSQKASGMLGMIESGKYLPQEGLDYVALQILSAGEGR